MKPNCFPNYLYLYLYLYLNESYSDVWNFLFVLSLHHFKSLRWTSSHAANAPSEDRSASLVNVLLQPLPHSNFDNETQIDDNYNNGEYQSLIRLNLWSVIDGHGGGCVATYASEVLLPHIAASVSRALGCAIVSRGVCLVNGQLRDANALDLDGLIKSSISNDRNPSNPNSIHYRSPYEGSNVSTTDDSDNEKDDADDYHITKVVEVKQQQQQHLKHRDEIPCHKSPASATLENTLPLKQRQQLHQHADDAASVVFDTPPDPSSSAIGLHSPEEITAITQAITHSFLNVDEGWINSIDPVATHQTSCQSNGRWNSGACALTVFTVQRLEWTKVSKHKGSKKDHKTAEGEGGGGHDTSQNKDATRRKMLDHNATRASRGALKSANSFSTISSTSSLTTIDDRMIHNNACGLESEITETEGEEDDFSSINDQDGGDTMKRSRRRDNSYRNISTDIPKESHVSAPGGCSCHCYRAYDAMLYTAHVGDCRAVMLGSAPPRTINVHGSSTKPASETSTTVSGGSRKQTDDESSHHSSDETECLSSSDHAADSSDDEDIMADFPLQHNQNHHLDNATAVTNATTGASAKSYPSCMRVGRPPRRQSPSRRRRYEDLGINKPFIALPPMEEFRSIEIEVDPDYDKRRGHKNISDSNNEDAHDNDNNMNDNENVGDASSSSSPPSSQDSREFPPAIILPHSCRPIDLTTDHSAYNPTEITAVLRRCNNAPRAISAGLGGGIKRVAGSLAVTRALGDAYLKTQRLSFFPYKRHTPYITARPEVNYRPIVMGGDKVLVLASDGVWERASGEDILRWGRTFYAERLAEAERRESIGRLNKESRHINNDNKGESLNNDDEDISDHEDTLPLIANRKRDTTTSIPTGNDVKRRKLSSNRPTPRRLASGFRRNSTVADVIVRRVLNKVRRARNISSLHALMSLPPGRARRSKHDDITISVVDLSSFVS